MARDESPDHTSDLGATGERIDALLTASATGGVVARERAEELVRLVTDLLRSGLEQVMEILHASGHLDDDLLRRLASDELVSGLLLVHGLHPEYSVEQRVEDGLESVRPYLGSHGGDVELLAVTDDGTVRLRLLGSCDGCPSSSVTLKLAVEGAIEAAAPEVVSIEVETPSESSPAGPALIPVGLVDVAPARRCAQWRLAPRPQPPPRRGEVVTARVGDTGVLACRIGQRVRVRRPLRTVRVQPRRRRSRPTPRWRHRRRAAQVPQLPRALRRPQGRQLRRCARAPPRPAPAAQRGRHDLRRRARRRVA